MKKDKEKDKIIIGGVEYEKTTFEDNRPGSKVFVLMPKRKQTGWICRNECGSNGGSCVLGWSCSLRCGDANWRPFYGKVVE